MGFIGIIKDLHEIFILGRLKNRIYFKHINLNLDTHIIIMKSMSEIDKNLKFDFVKEFKEFRTMLLSELSSIKSEQREQRLELSSLKFELRVILVCFFFVNYYVFMLRMNCQHCISK